jgi:hypothetical protein
VISARFFIEKRSCLGAGFTVFKVAESRDAGTLKNHLSGAIHFSIDVTVFFKNSDKGEEMPVTLF